MVYDTLVGGVATRRIRDAKDDEIEKEEMIKDEKERKKESCARLPSKQQGWH